MSEGQSDDSDEDERDRKNCHTPEEPRVLGTAINYWERSTSATCEGCQDYSGSRNALGSIWPCATISAAAADVLALLTSPPSTLIPPENRVFLKWRCLNRKRSESLTKSTAKLRTCATLRREIRDESLQ